MHITELLAKYRNAKRTTGTNIPMPKIDTLHHYYFVNQYTVRPHWRRARPANNMDTQALATFLRQLLNHTKNGRREQLLQLCATHLPQLSHWCGNLDVVNPSDRGLRAIEGHWEKVLTMAMLQLKLTKITITEQEITALNVPGQELPFIVLDTMDKDAIHVVLFDNQTEALAYVAQRKSKPS